MGLSQILRVSETPPPPIIIIIIINVYYLLHTVHYKCHVAKPEKCVLQNVLIILALSHARGACRRNNITGVMWSHEDLHMMMILSVTRGPTCA